MPEAYLPRQRFARVANYHPTYSINELIQLTLIRGTSKKN